MSSTRRIDAAKANATSLHIETSTNIEYMTEESSEGKRGMPYRGYTQSFIDPSILEERRKKHTNWWGHEITD